jgi:lysophospholipase L1-like esterase
MRKIMIMLVVAVLGVLAYATPAQAVEIRQKVVVLGDSIVDQMCGSRNQAIPTRVVPRAEDVGCYGWSGATSGGLWRQTYEPGWIDPGNVNRPTQQFNINDAIKRADVVIIGLGTNNALRQQPTEWFGWDIDNFMRVANGKRVIWFDVAMKVWPGSIANDAQWRSAVAHDTVLWNKMSQYPNLTVLSWGGAVGSNQNYVLPDGVHLSDAGYFKRWEMARMKK